MTALLNLIRQQIRLGWRYRWLALAFAWAICIGGSLAISKLPDVYESNARLYVDTDAVLTPLLRGLALEDDSLYQLDILQRTLLSRPNLEKLISKTGMDLTAVGPGARDQLIRQLGKDIKIVAENRTLFSIGYRSYNPQLAQSVVRTILLLYMEQAKGSSRADTENAQQFVDQQIAFYEQRLHAAEKRRANFLSKYIDVLPGADGGASRLETARSQLRGLQGDLQDTIARRNILMADLKTTPPVLTTDPESPVFVGNFTTPLAEAERQLRELQLNYTDKDPDVVLARQRVEMLKGGSGSAPITGRARSISNPVYEQLKVRLVDVNATISSLERRIRETTAERDRLEGIARGEPELQAQAINLDRDYTTLKKDYEELLARRESMRIATAANKEADKVKMSIVDPPTLPRVPAGPNRRLLFSGLLVAGIGAGVALPIMLVQLDQSFATIQELRGFGRPVLGGISLLNSAPTRRQLASALVFIFGVLILIALIGGLVAGILKVPRVV